MLGHMAKLVALDALALAEGITTDADDTFNSGDPDADDPVTSAIDFFVTQ